MVVETGIRGIWKFGNASQECINIPAFGRHKSSVSINDAVNDVAV
jgi:hypothetical protein